MRPEPLRAPASSFQQGKERGPHWGSALFFGQSLSNQVPQFRDDELGRTAGEKVVDGLGTGQGGPGGCLLGRAADVRGDQYVLHVQQRIL